MKDEAIRDDFTMTIKSLGLKAPKYIMDGTSISETYLLMKNYKVAMALVVDENVVLKGIITEGDFLRKANAKKIHPKETIDSLIMRTPFCLRENDSLYEAFELMFEKNCRYIPIVNEDRRPVGILSQRDLMGHFYKEHKQRNREAAT